MKYAAILALLLLLSGCALSTAAQTQPSLQPTTAPAQPTLAARSRPVVPFRPIHPSQTGTVEQVAESYGRTRITTFSATADPAAIKRWYQQELLAAGWRTSTSTDPTEYALPASDSYLYSSNWKYQGAGEPPPVFELLVQVEP